MFLFLRPRQGYIEKLLGENNFIPGFYKRKKRGHRARLLGLLGEQEGGKERGDYPRLTTSGGLEAPTTEDPRWRLEVGQNFQATAVA